MSCRSLQAGNNPWAAVRSICISIFSINVHDLGQASYCAEMSQRKYAKKELDKNLLYHEPNQASISCQNLSIPDRQRNPKAL